MSTYPTLRLGILQGLSALKASLLADADYLRKPDCPYDEETVKVLEELLAPVVREVVKTVTGEARKRGRPRKDAGISEEDANEVEVEAQDLLEELRDLKKTTEGEQKNLDTATRLTIIKTQVALTEKIVSIRERFNNVRKMSQFQSTVLGILDDLVPEEARDEFIRRLEPYRS